MSEPKPLGEEQRQQLERWGSMLDDGLAEDVLEETSRHLAGSPEDDDVALMRASALSDLGCLEEAMSELEELAEIYPDDDDILTELARAAFLCCRFDVADQASARAVELDGECTPALHLRGLLAERAGDFDEADRLLTCAHEQDPTLFHPPLHLSDEQFAAVTEGAIAELPATFAPALANLVIVEEPLPSDAVLATLGEEADPLLLGLYTGVPSGDESVFDGVQMPPQVQLFRRNIERAGTSPEEIREELRITLFHEIGHHLGFDEDGVEQMGLA